MKTWLADSLNIDRSLTAGLGRQPEDKALGVGGGPPGARAGWEVVAEGVETAEQVERARKLECDAAQGLYFSEPVASDEASELIVSGVLLKPEPRLNYLLHPRMERVKFLPQRTAYHKQRLGSPLRSSPEQARSQVCNVAARVALGWALQ